MADGQRSTKERNITFKVIVPRKPALTVTGSFNAFNASAFNFKSLRTTSPRENTGTYQMSAQHPSLKPYRGTIVINATGKGNKSWPTAPQPGRQKAMAWPCKKAKNIKHVIYFILLKSPTKIINHIKQ